MYDDIGKSSYKFLRNRVERKTEYKTSGACTLKQYPIGDRKFAQRFFIEDEGVFRCFYTHRMNWLGPDVRQQDSFYGDGEVCRIHPDNTMEFINFRCMHQQQMAGAMLGEYVSQSSKHKGAIITHKDNHNGNYITRDVLHPVFRGLRVSIDAPAKAVTPYTVLYRKLKPKAAAEVMGEYQEFLTMWQIMLGAMTAKGILDMLREIAPRDPEGEYLYCRDQVMDRVRDYIGKGHYVDAALMFALDRGIVWPGILKSNSTINTLYMTNRIRAAISTTFREKILMEHPEVFTTTERRKDEPLKSTTWGYDIRLDQANLFDNGKVTR